jgi:hypothetical protein
MKIYSYLRNHFYSTLSGILFNYLVVYFSVIIYINKRFP